MNCIFLQFRFHFSWNITEECNSINGVCDEHLKYSPVCDIINRKQYYSACHAGCTTVSIINEKKVSRSNIKSIRQSYTTSSLLFNNFEAIWLIYTHFESNYSSSLFPLRWWHKEATLNYELRDKHTTLETTLINYL